MNVKREKKTGKVLKIAAAFFVAVLLVTGVPEPLAQQMPVCTTATVKAASKADKKLIKALDKLLKARKITKKTKKKTALKKLFNYMSGSTYGYQRAYGFKNTSDWAVSYAKEMLSGKKGSCYHYAAAFAFAAKRATGYPVRICIGTSNAFNESRWQAHAWVEIKISGKWYTFDTNAARYSSRRKGKWYMQKSSSLKNKVYKTEKTVTVKI